MRRLRDLPIRTKLTVAIIVTSTVALTLAAIVLAAFDMAVIRRAMIRDTTVMADVIARNTEAALAFGDPDAARKTLGSLESEVHVSAACLYDTDGKLFAEYARPDHVGTFPAKPGTDGHLFDSQKLALFRPITLNKKRIGTIYLEAPMKRLHDRLRDLAFIGMLVLAGAFLVALALSRRMQAPIAVPLLALTNTSRAITRRGDFTIRATRVGDDEIGELTSAFNQMLDVLAERERALREEIAERQNAEAQVAELNERLEARVRERTAQLERANQEMESFSYTVSHDLRAPLRAVDGYSRLLEEDHGHVLDDDAKRLLAVVRDEARRMGVLIDDLLAFSRLSGQTLRPSPLNLGTMAEDIVRELRRSQPERKIDLKSTELPPALADGATMRQVLVNLLSNAVKYAKAEGEIRIELGGRTDGDMNAYWVRDEGVGFDMRYVDKIFGVFQRLHGDEFEGTGVGLAIVDRIVAKHGGEVRAEGAPGKGACFHFTLPAATSQLLELEEYP
ncbi:MAG TPA: ATP-binding protein [Thermoanaerobaculia bacterium]|jgi:signal transduction histidine kinase|nr:ATP-binding protein [Thermoanaerobaculia bacterium]